MSLGNNSAFKKQKNRFLVLNPITVGFEQANMPAVAGIHDFDIQSLHMPYGNVLEVIGFNNRNKQTVGCTTHRISAFWLPWNDRAAVHADLNGAADYFFTSEINGCQFRVARRGPDTVRAIHSPGGGLQADHVEGSQRRSERAEALLTAAEAGASHRFTVSAPLGATVPGPAGFAGAGHMVGYDGAQSWQNIFGFRHWHICGPATWDFWYQTVAPAPGNAGYVAHAARLCAL